MFFANLLVYMMAIYHQDGSWTKLVQQHHAECPSTISDPWGLILNCDEIIPGNVLGRAERKVWTIYATFLQFGDHLPHEDAWLTISVERSTFVATLDGGIAQMMGHVLQSIFCCPIQDPRLGFRLKATSGDTTLFFPTSLCGVLVFDSVSRAPSPPPASSSRFLTYTTINLTYNNFTHTNLTYNNFTHTNLTYINFTPHKLNIQ